MPHSQPSPIPSGITPLMLCATVGNAEILKRLLTFPNIDLNVTSASDTALTLALKSGNLLCAQLLLERDDVNVDEGNSRSGALPNLPFVQARQNEIDGHLALAVRRGFIGIVEKLLQKPGVDINRRGEGGNTPLMIAVQNQNAKIISMLMDFSTSKPSPTESSASNSTLTASEENQVNETDGVISARTIDLDIRNNQNERVIDIALNIGNADITSLLLSSPPATDPISSSSQPATPVGLGLAQHQGYGFNRPRPFFGAQGFPTVGGTVQSNSESMSTGLDETAVCEIVVNAEGQQLRFGDDGVTLYCGRGVREHGNRTTCSSRSNCQDCRKIQTDRARSHEARTRDIQPFLFQPPTATNLNYQLLRSSAPFVLRITLAEGAVVRTNADIDQPSFIVNTLPYGTVVDAFECREFEGYRRYRVSNGWISDMERGGDRRQIVEVLRGNKQVEHAGPSSINFNNSNNLSTQSTALFVLRITLAEGAVVRTNADIEKSVIVRTLPYGSVVEAYETTSIFQGGYVYNRYRISDGWISDKERYGGREIVELLREQRSENTASFGQGVIPASLGQGVIPASFSLQSVIPNRRKLTKNKNKD